MHGTTSLKFFNYINSFYLYLYLYYLYLYYLYMHLLNVFFLTVFVPVTKYVPALTLFPFPFLPTNNSIG